jgi:hypothetical protein
MGLWSAMGEIPGGMRQLGEEGRVMKGEMASKKHAHSNVLYVGVEFD